MSTALLTPTAEPVQPRAWTAEDLLTLPDGDAYELVDGHLVERNMSATSSWVAGEIYGLLREFNRLNPIGWVFPEGTSFQCFPGDRNRTRRADTAVVLRGRFPNEAFPAGHIRIPPNLAVEVISPHDTYYEVAEKRVDWTSAGVPLLWIVDPERRAVTVYRVGAPNPTELTGDAEITGEDVLPGFRRRISDFFPPRPAPAPASETPAAPGQDSASQNS